MDNYIPVTEAIKRTNIPDSQLQALAKSGKIKSVMLNNQIFLRESDVMANSPKDRYPELSGSSISIRGAARKYGITSPTISRWVARGLIRIVKQVGNKIMIDESDMAYMADYYTKRPGRGRRTDIDLGK